MKLPTRHAHGPNRPLRVLVVDDSEPIRQVLARLLANLQGVELAGEAADGLQALQAISRLRPDLVILDIHMPAMNGLELLQALRDLRPICKVIVFTQLGDELYRRKCLDLGALAFYDKIANFEEFHQALKSLAADMRALPHRRTAVPDSSVS